MDIDKSGLMQYSYDKDISKSNVLFR